MDASTKSVKLWFDGEVRPVEEASIPVTWIGPRLASAVFDGIRAYWNAEQERLYIFRLADHMARLGQARRFMNMEGAWTDEELTEAVVEILRVNDFREDAYVAPTAFFGVDTARGGTPSLGQNVHIAITPRAWASSLGEDEAIDCAVSSWVRIADHVMPPRIKCISNYHNYRLATMDAWRQGGSCPAVLSAADDVAVHSFLSRKIGFTDIPKLVDQVLSEHERTSGQDATELLEVDRWATARAEELVKRSN